MKKKLGFRFPGTYEITAMGAVGGSLERVVPATLEALGLTVYRNTLTIRPSHAGNYVSVTVQFVAESREDYEAAHGALRRWPHIRWTF